MSAAVDELESGLIRANLGGGVIKQRIARPGRGKSGGFRTIILYKAHTFAFFVYGFAKSERDNIETDEVDASKVLASELMVYDDAKMDNAIRSGALLEIKHQEKQYRSPIMASIHETVEELHAAGVMDKSTMRRFDEMCLTPITPLNPHQIRELREREGASQAVFARYLNVTTSLVSQWERGKKRPQGASLKLLTLVAEKGLDAVA